MSKDILKNSRDVDTGAGRPLVDAWVFVYCGNAVIPVVYRSGVG